jgi:hypothetical protein
MQQLAVAESSAQRLSTNTIDLLQLSATYPRWQSPSEGERRCIHVSARCDPVLGAIWSLQYIRIEASLRCSPRGVGADLHHKIATVVNCDSLGGCDGLALCVGGCSK